MKIPSLNDLLEAGRKVPWRDIARDLPWEAALRGVAEAQGHEQLFEKIRSSGSDEELLAQVKAFGSSFAKNVGLKIGGALLKTEKCVSCDALGLIRCEACGHRACLGHALIGFDVTGICDQCAAKLTGTRKQAPPRQHREAKPPADPVAQHAARVAVAWQTLGLPPGTPFAEVKKHYRKLSRDAHPDRAKDPADRRARTERMKALNSAFELIKRSHERSKEAA